MSGERAKSPQYWVLAALLVVTFLLGGGARADIQSLIVLRPLAAIAFGYALWTVNREQLRSYSLLVWLLVLSAALIAIQLVPLPPALWHALPGRDIVVRIDEAAGLGQLWRPIAMVPSGAWNALYSMLVPAAVLLLAVQLGARERAGLLPIVIGIGGISGLLGLAQVLGGESSPFYFYRETNIGYAVGLFANRNHAAIYLACLFPMLAVQASIPAKDDQQTRVRMWLALAFGLVLLPMVIVSGSRAGVILSVIGIASVPFLFKNPLPRRRSSLSWRQRRPFIIAGAVTGVIALALVVVALLRSEVGTRLAMLANADDMRFQVWGVIWHQAWQVFPFGSGAGSFVELFQIREPDDVLMPTYLNHAHNDFLEWLLTFGLPGVLLVAAGLAGWTRRTFLVWSARESAPRFGRMASVVLLMLLLSSLGDYPLRVPSLISIAVLAGIWLHQWPRREMGATREGRGQV